jgi:uncharacterized membrane protein (DUF485 family)
MNTTSPPSDGDRYLAVHDSAQFVALHQRWRTFVLRASASFLGWWFLVIVLGAFAPDLFRTKVAGDLNVGVLFALGSFAAVLVITPIYLRYARTQLDPAIEKIRTELEGDVR